MSRQIPKIIALAALGIILSAPTAGAQDFIMVCEDSTLQGTVGDTLYLLGTVTNLTQDWLTLNVDIDINNFGGWWFQACLGVCVLPYVTSFPSYIGPDSTELLEIKVVPEEEPDPASLVVMVDSDLNPGSPQSVTFTVYITPLGIEVEATTIKPGDFTLSPAFPNPFNPGTTFSYSSGQAEDVRIAVYNPMGQKVRTLFEGVQVPGTHIFIWDGRNDRGLDLPGALYIITVDNGRVVRTVKTLKLK